MGELEHATGHVMILNHDMADQNVKVRLLQMSLVMFKSAQVSNNENN
jgi:hypothetical protein